MDNGSAFGEGSWIFGLIVLLGLFGGFNGGFGGNNAANAAYATMADVNSAVNNQSVQQALSAIQLSSANNNYETAQLISNQNMAMMNQSNTNLLAAINGFNNLSNSVQGGFSNLSAQIAQLGYQVDRCCCDLKSQALENRLADKEAELLSSRNANAIFAQNQYLLSQLGTYTPATAGGVI